MNNDLHDIRLSIDDYFADVAKSPSMQNKVLAQIGDRPKMKRRLSAALVVAMVFVLITLTALAVTLLKGQDFLLSVLMPAAQESHSDKFTREELDMIMELADKNQIVLPPLWQEKLAKETSEYKDEVFRAFMKSEYGFYPMAWPMEVQIWFDEVLAQMGYQPDQSNLCLPKGNDKSEEEILEIAKSHAIERFGLKADDFTRDTCVVERVFYQPLGTQRPTDREWYIQFLWTDSSIQSHTLLLTPDGAVKEAT